MATSGSSDHIDAAKRRLVHLSGLSGQVAESERRILEAAEGRLEAVQADLTRLAPRALADAAAGARYTDLVHEKGRLATIIASARAQLGHTQQVPA